MIIKTFTILLCLFITSFISVGSICHASEAASGAPIILKEPVNPEHIHVHNNRLFVADFPKIHVYSLTDFSLIKSFGKEGEGPKEFLVFIELIFHGNTLIVQSNARFSFYNLDTLEYQNEDKVPILFNRGVKPFGDGFIVSHTAPRENKPDKFDLSVNFYDAKYQLVKEFYKQGYYFLHPKGVNALYLPEVRRRTGIRFFLHGENIYIEDKDGETGNIHVFDKNGNKLQTLSHQLPKPEVTAKHIESIKEHMRLKKSRIFDILEQRKKLLIPDAFPAIHLLDLVAGKFHMLPYKTTKGKNEFHIFNLEGKLLKKAVVPLAYETLFLPYPVTIANDTCYQLMETEDEEWELRITPLQVSRQRP
ncbi:MAG: hypothetical protein GY765_13335 [bacterium]|nr:hypothetical protein [bacterium]